MSGKARAPVEKLRVQRVHHPGADYLKLSGIIDKSFAIEKLGAKLDGILRQDRIVRGGRTRDSAVYSILAHEWPMVRAGLEARL